MDEVVIIQDRRDEIIMKSVYHPVVMVVGIHLKICKLYVVFAVIVVVVVVGEKYH